MRVAGDPKRPHVLTPFTMIAGSFAIVILVGGLLLSLPISAKDGSFTNLFDSLFTATSATCVTGLILFDTYTQWTVFGQCVIMLLIQIGGIGLVTLTTFFTLAFRRRLGLRDMQLAQETVNTNTVIDIPRLLRIVIVATLAFELTGAAIMATRFIPLFGARGIFISVFMAVSAYCNAGFDVLGFNGEFSNLCSVANEPIITFTVAFLIIFGGIGFIVINDIFSYRKTHRLMMHTKIVLLVTAFLVILGAIAILLLEFHNPETMGPLPWWEKISTSFFQSVTARTAGFNVVSMEGLTDLSKLTTIVLMFIGASSGSTGGGIKVTTFAVIVMTVISVLRNREETVIRGRKVDKRIIYKALTIVSLALIVVLITTGVIILSDSTNKISALGALFESTSAFGTVGLTVGVTTLLSPIARLFVMLTMFIGRVGPISLVFALTLRAGLKKEDVLPEARIMVG